MATRKFQPAVPGRVPKYAAVSAYANASRPRISQALESHLAMSGLERLDFAMASSGASNGPGATGALGEGGIKFRAAPVPRLQGGLAHMPVRIWVPICGPTAGLPDIPACPSA